MRRPPPWRSSNVTSSSRRRRRSLTVCATSGLDSPSRSPSGPAATTAPRPDGAAAWTSLEDLYVHLGLGAAQDVGSSATSGHTVRKRVHEHAAALNKVMSSAGLEHFIERLAARH